MSGWKGTDSLNYVWRYVHLHRSLSEFEIAQPAISFFVANDQDYGRSRSIDESNVCGIRWTGFQSRGYGHDFVTRDAMNRAA
jgi:hypothetical protein